MTYRQLFRNTMIGLALASLPLFLCWGLAETMVLYGIDYADVTPRQAHTRRSYAALSIILGLIMSGIAWLGMVMYIFAKLFEIIPRNRHERKLQNMRELGEIDF